MNHAGKVTVGSEGKTEYEWAINMQSFIILPEVT